MIERPPILITGAARSGAGMIAGVINLCGAFGGVMPNKKGLYENEGIRDTVVKPYLRKCGADPEGQNPLLDLSKEVRMPMNFRTDVEGIIKQHGYEMGPWMYKDARIALMWPVWHYAFPDAKWIIVRRRTGDIIDSCLKTGYMTAYDTSLGWLGWVHEYEKRFVSMITEGVNCKIIWPERMVHGDFQQLYETLEWVGLPWKTEVLTFIDPLLWGNRRKKKGNRNGKSDGR